MSMTGKKIALNFGGMSQEKVRELAATTLEHGGGAEEPAPAPDAAAPGAPSAPSDELDWERSGFATVNTRPRPPAP